MKLSLIYLFYTCALSALGFSLYGLYSEGATATMLYLLASLTLVTLAFANFLGLWLICLYFTDPLTAPTNEHDK